MLPGSEARVKIGAEDRIEELLSLPKCVGGCDRGGKPVHLRDLKNPGQDRVTQFACKSWSCRVCSAYLRRKYGTHYAQMILVSSGSLFSKRIDPAAWDSQQRALRRKRAEWVRVGARLIWCEPCPPGVTAHADTEGAVRFLGGALGSIHAPPAATGKRFRPVASSKGWRIPKKERRYQRLGWVTVSEPSSVLEKLNRIGIRGAWIKQRPATSAKLWDAIFPCPDELQEMAEWVLQH
jgi:hypothetical protein